jgi:uncharacterized protein YoxC
MNKNIGLIISIATIIGGIVLGYGKLQAQSDTTERRVNKIEEKVEGIKEQSDKVETTQEGMTKQLDKVETKIDKILDLTIKGIGKNK